MKGKIKNNYNFKPQHFFFNNLSVYLIFVCLLLWFFLSNHGSINFKFLILLLCTFYFLYKTLWIFFGSYGIYIYKKHFTLKKNILNIPYHSRSINYKEIDKLFISNKEFSNDSISFSGIRQYFVYDNAIRIELKDFNKPLIIDFEDSDFCEKIYNRLISLLK